MMDLDDTTITYVFSVMNELYIQAAEKKLSSKGSWALP